MSWLGLQGPPYCLVFRCPFVRLQPPPTCCQCVDLRVAPWFAERNQHIQPGIESSSSMMAWSCHISTAKLEFVQAYSRRPKGRQTWLTDSSSSSGGENDRRSTACPANRTREPLNHTFYLRCSDYAIGFVPACLTSLHCHTHT